MDQDHGKTGRIFRLIGGFSFSALSAAVIGSMLCMATIAFLAKNVRGELENLAVVSVDNLQWTIGQTELELLLLQKTLRAVLAQKALADNAASLAKIRLRFDIFYSRIRLIAEGQQFAAIRKDVRTAEDLLRLNAFLDKYTAMFDGPDSALFAHLPEIEADVEKLMPIGREVALLGVRLHAAEVEVERQSIALALGGIGLLAWILALVLLAVIAMLVALFHRITQSERGTEVARSRLQTVIATSLDGIITANRDGLIIDYNGAAEHLFGHDKSAAIGHGIDLIVPAHLRPAHVVGMERVRQSGEKNVVGRGLVQLEALHKDGTVFPVEMSLASAILDGSEFFVGFIRDISDRVKFEQELIEARDRALEGKQAKAEFLTTMSHEMRTPLNGILGAIELLEAEKSRAHQARFVAAIKTSARLLLHHVNGVLTMARAEAGRIDLFPLNVDPSDLLRELVESQRHALKASGNRIKCHTDAAPGRIFLDPLRLRQVILNLIGNANKFTRNGEILVECDTIPGADLVEFRVIDTGIGIAHENLERIFEEFRTLDASYSRTAEGSGLGLAISRRLVQAMGGEIGVDSEPGEGSLFWVRLPIGPVVEEEAIDLELRSDKPDSKGLQHQVRPMRVLLVEDNHINRLVAREMLIRDGHSVLEAHDGREGVRLAGIQPFDVILMDISMPELDGVTATSLIRESLGPNRNTPIFALTAHAFPEDAERFREAGITTTLIKPLSSAALRAALSATMPGKYVLTSAEESAIPETFANLVASLGREAALGLFDSFRNEAEELIQRVSSQNWAAETDSVRADAVHKLAGSASVLGASRFRRHLQLLERDYRAGQIDAATRHLVLLEESWSHTLAEIEGCKSCPAEV